ncbi:MAG: family 10 glycosylhydrolase [Marinilabilia sp.]
MKKKFLVLGAWLLVVLLNSCSPNSSSNTDKDPEKNILGYDEPVRGVWLTNVASDALYSKENIAQAVKKCDDMGINTIFVVTWNKAMTMYHSEVMKDFTGVAVDPELDPDDIGRDPLQEVIDEAHARDIKVFAWFEFGFSSAYNDDGGVIVDKKPEWASLTSEGELCTKNNFDWLNALDPEVQDFMLSLILEVVEGYDVDGIQGDDRLPAMPSSGGYNPKVVEQYKEEHFGEDPPEYHKDFGWVQWRAEKLNDFMKRLYGEVKEADPECIVSMSPSVFPWSKAEYLQDWPTWVNFGYVDMVCPQVYRKDSASYKETLEANLEYVLPEKRHLVYPGMLIQVDDYQPSVEFFRFMMETNRDMGIDGEVHFFYEGLDAYKSQLKEYYN